MRRGSDRESYCTTATSVAHASHGSARFLLARGHPRGRGHIRQRTAVTTQLADRADQHDRSRHSDAGRRASLAGLLEGEGTFSLTCDAKQRCYPVVSVNMCDELVVRRAAEVLGARKVARRIPDQPHWRPTYVAKIGGAHAAEWMRGLQALMSRRRQAAIELALAAYRPVRLVSPLATCILELCDQPHRGRGLCHKHYMMWSRDQAKGRVARITPLR